MKGDKDDDTTDGPAAAERVPDNKDYEDGDFLCSAEINPKTGL